MLSETDPRTLGLLKQVEVQDPITHLNLTVVPLTGNGHGQFSYVLGADAIEGGTLRITEVSEAGSVPELLATSTADQPVLLLDGEVLLGAKQHRVLNTTVLLPAKATVKIPVSCVEHGRWRHTSRAFRPGNHSSSRLRARKSSDVGRSLRIHGMPTSDQGAVWREVASCLDSMGASSPTGALNDAHTQRREAIDQYLRALSYPEDARGVAVAIDGKFAVIDLFDKPDTLRRVWPRLLKGYVLDALGKRPSEAMPFTAGGPKALLEHVAGVPCQPCPSVGIGEDWRFESEAVVGHALVADGACVHLCAFPKGDTQIQEPPRPNIRPPSHRRPRGRRRREAGPELF